MVFGRKKKKEAKRISFDDPEEEEVEEDFEDVEVPKPVRKKAKVERIEPTSSSMWEVKELAIQTEKVIFNNETGKAIDLHAAVAEILNRTEG